MTTKTIHDQDYEVFTWESFGKYCFEVSKKIIETQEKFDRIVALAKGGLPIVRPLADYIGVSEVSSIQIEFYTGIATTARVPVITQSLPVRVKGERVLIVDDVADSGESLLLAKRYLAQHGAIDSKAATIVTKPWTKEQPDFFGYVSKAWVVFPWETRETIQLLTKNWKEKGDETQKIRQELLDLGFSSKEIELFSK